MTVIYYILTVSLRILTEMCRLMTVILPDVTVWMRGCVDARETRFASMPKKVAARLNQHRAYRHNPK